MSQKRNSYHTNFKLAIKHNLIDKKNLKYIPKTTIHRFKNSDYSHIYGHNMVSFLDSKQDLINELVHSKNIIKYIEAVLFIKNSIIKIHTTIKNEFEKIKETVNTINEVKSTLGFSKNLLIFKHINPNLLLMATSNQLSLL